jgi:hypothetical protein
MEPINILLLANLFVILALIGVILYLARRNKNSRDKGANAESNLLGADQPPSPPIAQPTEIHTPAPPLEPWLGLPHPTPHNIAVAIICSAIKNAGSTSCSVKDSTTIFRFLSR